MMKSFRLSRYWVAQFAGWGLFALINVFFALLFNSYEPKILQRILFFMEVGVIFSHFMREVIHRSSVLLKDLRQQILTFILLTIAFSFFITCIVSPFEQLFQLRTNAEGEPVSYLSLFITNLISFIPLLLIWNAIYFMYHFIIKTRKQEMDTIKLEALVRQLELNTIKAHVNPHFIFNSLNGIRALVDENPERARSAITELSNILRSSLSAEKAETVALSQELKIVKDYLALESMRFEDRLRVEFLVDDNTLNSPVPPMMLQTLVENAIKHGISKQMKGGVIKIISDIKQNQHELLVQNTGHLNGYTKSTGFGIASTKDRLNLLYGEKASFEIKQLDPVLVEAKVIMPIK
ncbi:MAG TPA: histidine kinase [Flavisolibacter sp.]|jgi:sensor histidine kinase YesM|nr:histidine kinase [Flavisolibacter sp.]